VLAEKTQPGGPLQDREGETRALRSPAPEEIELWTD
jgi:hypothetical protein